MTKMTIEIPTKRYKELKHRAIELGVSMKDYVLDALNLKENITNKKGAIVKKIKPSTLRHLEKSSAKKKTKPSKSNKFLIKKC